MADYTWFVIRSWGDRGINTDAYRSEEEAWAAWGDDPEHDRWPNSGSLRAATHPCCYGGTSKEAALAADISVARGSCAAGRWGQC